jgi:phage anti-repressor protein
MSKQYTKALLTERRQAVTYELPIIQQNENVYIDARLLHQKLKSKQQFANWIQNRITDYGFNQHEDYLINLLKSTGGRKAHEYLLSMDMAKELAMLERNEIGRSIRKYFITKEKELRGISALPKDSQLFKGIKAKRINNRMMYPYKQILQRIGYSTNANGQRKAKYWMHFVLDGTVNYITEEFATHLLHSRQVYNNRKVMQAAKPVIPTLFGDSSFLLTSKNA